MTIDRLPHRDDLDRIFALLLPQAKGLLEQHDGRFLPVGASLDVTGGLHASMAMRGQQDVQPRELVERMVDDFRALSKSGRLRACGVCYDAHIEQTGKTGAVDAIATWLEHKDGESVVIYVPYRRCAPHQFEYGTLIAADSPRRIW